MDLPDLGGAGALLLFEKRPPRDDELPAVFPELDDPERVDVPFVHRRVGGPDRVDLGHRAEGALAGDAHLVAALDHLFDLAFHRKTRAKRVFELPCGGGPERQPPGKDHAPRGRNHRRLDAVAHGDFEHAIVVLQFADVDRGFALAADVHEGHLGADRDDGALGGLAFLEALRLG